MNRRGLLLGGLVVLALGAIVAWWMVTFQLVPKEVAQPMRGEARYNPLFALKRTLEAKGITVNSRANLSLTAIELKPGDLLVLDTDVRTLTAPQAEALLGWVEAGAHLVFALPQGAEGRGGELLDSLGLSVADHFSCMQWLPPGATDAVSHCFEFAFLLDDVDEDDFDWLWGADDDGYVMGRQQWGDGSVFVAADLDFLGNDQLDHGDNAALAWQVLAPALGHGTAHLVYAADVPPLYVLIVTRGWPALVPLTLALFGWLWARSQRLGPVMPSLATNRRALLEHVQAAGEFAFRRGRGMSLYTALRRAFVRRLQRRDPVVGALDGEALVLALAARDGRSADDVRLALNPVDLGRPDRFLATIKTLLELNARS